jgi:predicted kinase
MDPTSHQTPLIIIVAGPSGTGKTWLSKRLAQDLRLPGLHRDDLKEHLFDTLGSHDRAWSRLLGGASYELLFHTLALLLQTGHPCLVESNVYGEPATTKLCTLIQRYQYYPFQILCHTTPTVLVDRLRKRVTSGERHPGHADHEDIDSLSLANVIGRYDPLPLDGSRLEVDTTDFGVVDYDALVAQIAVILAEQRGEPGCGRTRHCS